MTTSTTTGADRTSTAATRVLSFVTGGTRSRGTVTADGTVHDTSLAARSQSVHYTY